MVGLPRLGRPMNRELRCNSGTVPAAVTERNEPPHSCRAIVVFRFHLPWTMRRPGCSLGSQQTYQRHGRTPLARDRRPAGVVDDVPQVVK